MMTSSSDELLDTGIEPVIAIEHLRVVRGKRPAIHDLSVRIARGTITGLLGPSGCGKTTLIRCIVGTQIVTGGRVTVLGHAAGSAPLRGRVGYMPQDATIYDDLRVVDNVRYFGSLYEVDSKSADEAVSAVGLDDHRTALCSNLSGGQRARVSLACALVAAPDVLVLDEPTVGLDPVLRVDLWEQFQRLAQRGTTLLVSSHVMDEADHCGDLLLMREGHLLAHTTPRKLREETGCQSLEEAFLSVIRHSTEAAAS
ncbi:ABC transporter ATP-binding protein [Mycobacterium sp. 1274761.0]|uniref:ABC transporter ATP-binding protein n=1 Tax=Mycobacterium sp. 1274761.0 TaxID=1834077 RepID=UPI0007FF3F49|nr:ABC transporter ATP-binding protein [Mycobacterium sp. 1274761.0]OBK71453.1 multidrug ABC transporter ATP-binding protein [Mycobacterium sp. 1274761.0]